MSEEVLSWPVAEPRAVAPPQRGQVQLWRVATGLGEQRWRKLEDTLPPEDQHRARAMRDAGARRRFVVARAALRAVVAGCLGGEHRAARLVYGPLGKPELPASLPLHVNVSHAGGWAVVAAGPRAPGSGNGQPGIGVDLEEVRSRPGMERLIARRFTPAERDLLAALPREGRAHAFYMLWCRKEACLKAAGGGLAAPWDALDMTGALDPNASATIPRPGIGGLTLHVTGFDPAPGYTGALATPWPVALLAWTLPAEALLAYPLGA